jgi:hypothetical protein
MRCTALAGSAATPARLITVLALLGGPLSARLRPDRAMRLGALAYALCVAGILVTLGAAAIVPFLAVSLLAGITQGVAQTGGMRGLLAGTGPADRAGRPGRPTGPVCWRRCSC